MRMHDDRVTVADTARLDPDPHLPRTWRHQLPLGGTQAAARGDLDCAIRGLGVAGSYSASKAALWSQTNSLRLELKPRGIDVTGLHVGYVDTDMAAGVDAAKSSPEAVAALAVDGVESGAYEVLADDLSRRVKAGLAADIETLYPQLVK